ncbi:MAG TPA: UDP-galactopyranose mutase [Clostridia bacterium]|nr:UDP-galactopyranose mutase [Clostridia bacterium]
MKKYDYVIVGSGLFGSTFAHEMTRRGRSCMVVERRNHIGGNVYTELTENIYVHKYGPHIFHTNSRKIWEYVNRLAEFRPFTFSPVANYKGVIYNLPFNMNTFNRLFGVVTPEEAETKLKEERKPYLGKSPENLEEQALSMVGREIYEKLIKGYTEKQWGMSARELPAFIIRRLPVRFTYDNNYFNDLYQGIPAEGYTRIIERMLEGCEIALGSDYLQNRSEWDGMADKIVYTGMIDEFYGYRFGHLRYRSLRFEQSILDVENYQGNAMVNYTDTVTPYTRIVEHKHFLKGNQPNTVITREYPIEWEEGREPYYPVNDKSNTETYNRYRQLADMETKHIFGGRLAEYRYYDMDQVMERAIEAAEQER